MKRIAYIVKDFCRDLFIYPKDVNVHQVFEYDDYWKEKRGHEIGALSGWQKERADFILQFLGSGAEKGVTIADVGCGDGSILAYVKKNMSKEVRCVGYDSSVYALEKAREFGIETHTIELSQTELWKTFIQADYYLLLETLEHIPNSEELLLLILSKSQKGVFFSFPNTGFLRHRLRMFFGRFPLQWYRFPGEHVRFWTYTDLRWWLKALGITDYEIVCYRGVPILNKILPGLFSAGFFVFIRKGAQSSIT